MNGSPNHGIPGSGSSYGSGASGSAVTDTVTNTTPGTQLKRPRSLLHTTRLAFAAGAIFLAMAAVVAIAGSANAAIVNGAGSGSNCSTLQGSTPTTITYFGYTGGSWSGRLLRFSIGVYLASPTGQPPAAYATPVSLIEYSTNAGSSWTTYNMGSTNTLLDPNYGSGALPMGPDVNFGSPGLSPVGAGNFRVRVTLAANPTELINGRRVLTVLSYSTASGGGRNTRSSLVDTTSAAPASVTYNAGTEFNNTQGGTTGVWQYGQTNPQPSNVAFSGTGGTFILGSFTGAYFAGNSGGFPVVTGTFMHPAGYFNGIMATLRFKALVAGTYKATFSARLIDTGNNPYIPYIANNDFRRDGVRMWLNDASFDLQTWDQASAPQSFQLQTLTKTFTLAQDGTIDFSIDPNGARGFAYGAQPSYLGYYIYDSTSITATVEFVPAATKPRITSWQAVQPSP